MKSVCNKWGHRDVGASNVQSKEGESEERLVDPADHDAGILLPVLDVAVMGQSRSSGVLDGGRAVVNGDVEIRLEADTAVQDYGESKSSDGEEGRCHELHEMYSQQGGLIVFFCGPVLPK